MRHPLTLADGTRLHREAWLRPGAQGCVLIVHGLGEHIGRYAAVAQRLNAVGWDVAGYDHRGHGASAGARGAIPQPDALLADLATVIDALRQKLHGPLVLLGHSMGGLVAARFVAEGLQPQPQAWHRAVDALVLSSPALDPGLNPLQKLLLATTRRLAPNVAVGNGLKPAWISRDPAVVAAYESDPLVHDRVTPRLARFIVDGAAFVRERAPRWKLPTLLLWAGADRCVAPSGSVAFAQAAPPAVVRAHAFPRLYHEIFNEPERDEVLGVLTGWLGQLATPGIH
jgi:alpha-beta hydrolase superfamily lysophospholipase